MPKSSPLPTGSGAEDKFIDLFCEAFGAEKGQYVYLQYPTVDIYGNHRTIDFAVNLPDGKIAIEVDGNTWHQPGVVSMDKYHDDLLKQNSMVYDGWKVYRWTSAQLDKTPERVKDELITFLGTSPAFRLIDDELPAQFGEAIELMDHQEEALRSLDEMRAENKSIALLYHATGTGKTITAVSDAKHFGKKTLFLAHRHELVDQAVHAFQQVWPEAAVGRYEGSIHEPDAYIVCGSVQSVSQNLDDFDADEIGYLIIDECHHGTAESYRKILSYFHPEFTLGLTATPERTDGEDLLGIFQNVAHKLDLKTAVEAGTLVPVRCIRIKTNISLRDVRISGFKYNTLDLETTIRIPERNQLIVDTYSEYVHSKPTVVFCTSVRHAEEVAELFRAVGVSAECVSGSTKAADRKRILADYEQGEIPVLCACDLLNEGWDSPHTEVLFMARPTMSKTIYMQQLGRGMRKAPGKEFLMVFDFVDNANLFNAPYSLHRMLGINEYREGGLVLGNRHDMHWDADMFRHGQKPAVLVDYPVHVTGFETVDLFNWQDKAKYMISQVALTRMVSVQNETVDRYIREGKMVPDLEVPVSDQKKFRFFNKSTVEKYAEQFGWTLITKSNIKEVFFQMLETMTMSYSYKPVFMNAFLDNMNEAGEAKLEDVARDFAAFYEKRIADGLPAEKKKCIFTRGGYAARDVQRLILSMPFRRFEDMHAMQHSKYLGTLQFDRNLFRQLTEKDYDRIREYCKEALKRYFGD
ncbi:MAG: DEAD/DEAH box helicase family protein [Lachnospiraceae bacterium]|nr:DEAD/DEAH box helicase family protein [Lachnospiraceae bacterium]